MSKQVILIFLFLVIAKYNIVVTIILSSNLKSAKLRHTICDIHGTIPVAGVYVSDDLLVFSQDFVHDEFEACKPVLNINILAG